MSMETLSLKLDEIKRQMAARQEESGGQKVNTASLLAQLDAQLTVKDAEARKAARKLIWKWVIAFLGLVGVPVGGYGAIQFSSNAPPRIEPKDVKQTVEHESKEVGAAIEKNAEGVKEAGRKIQKLGEQVIRIQDEQAEATQYLGDKLDAISPKARKIEPPPAVKRAQERAEKERLDKRVGDMFADD